MPNARDVFVGGAKVVGLAAAVWVMLIAMDLLTFYMIYSKATDTLILFGAMGEEGANIMGILFAVFVTFCFHGLSRHLLLRRKRGLFAIIVVAIAWFGMVGIAKAPYMADALFNGQGVAIYKYVKMPDGKIVKYPKGLTHDPKTNRPLAEFDTATADEYLAQETKRPAKPEAKNEPGFFDWLFGEKKPDPPEWALRMEVEQIDILPNKTVLHLAVTRTDNDRTGWFYQPVGNYLSDETGQTYDIQGSGAAYDRYVDSETHTADIKLKRTAVHEVRRDETYRFIDEYSPLKEGIHKLRLHDSRFAEVDLEYQLWQGQLQAEIRKRKDAEAQKAAQALEEEKARVWRLQQMMNAGQEPKAADEAAPAPPSRYVIPAPYIPKSVPEPERVREVPAGTNSESYVLSTGSGIKKFKIESVVKTVKVNRYRRPEEAFSLPGWQTNTRECRFSAVPTIDKEEVSVTFFKLEPDEVMVGPEFEKVFEMLKLKPDPYAAAAVNEADPEFARKHPNLTQWWTSAGYQVIMLRGTNYSSPKYVLYCGRVPMGYSEIAQGYTWWYTGIPK